ncbi:MAG: hypothetical protein U0441_17815 [Polyangiaceae bacterium]
MNRIRIVHEEGMLRIAYFQNVQINVWSDAPDVHQMRAFGRYATSFAGQRGKKTALLNGVIRGTPRFSDGVRDEVVKAMKLRGVFTLGAAHLITVGGFAGTATRAFLSTAILLSRSKNPTKVYGDPDEACEWITSIAAAHADPPAPEPWGKADLLAAYEEAITGR